MSQRCTCAPPGSSLEKSNRDVRSTKWMVHLFFGAEGIDTGASAPSVKSIVNENDEICRSNVSFVAAPPKRLCASPICSDAVAETKLCSIQCTQLQAAAFSDPRRHFLSPGAVRSRRPGYECAAWPEPSGSDSHRSARPLFAYDRPLEYVPSVVSPRMNMSQASLP